MVVNLKAKKRLTARVTGVGVHRIKFDPDHLDDVADAISEKLIRRHPHVFGDKNVKNSSEVSSSRFLMVRIS